MLPNPIKNFVEVFSKLPSIGPRQATRLAFYITSLGKNKVKEIASAVSNLADLTACSRCFRTHTGNEKLCSICSDPTRNQKLIAVVEKETDLLSLEKTKKFNGWYLVIGELHKNGELEPEQKLRLSALKNFIKKELPPSHKASEGKGVGKAEEIILATNPTVYGDLNAATLKKELGEFTDKITRLGRGIPTGGEIEFADEETLGSAIDKRS
ncbi:MAG: recombination protein RecR [Candidatus Harrisonbacteria bacterium]|nr:recombination protein RecR [Candidatus Harrisonbacteria bacterium]